MGGLQERLTAMPAARLQGMRRGVEKESLRVDAQGLLATTPHAAALGSALTHPHITTDFSESQVELITGVHASAAACEDELTRIHQAVYRAIDDERLWVGSMPCPLPPDDRIPIGRYGSSNVGTAKSVYRTGLGHRYGRRMQTISGIHYNWSLPGLSNDDHFGLIRNFRRHSFVLLYLFGASPAVCSSFVEGSPHVLQPLGVDTMHMPHATSLRMGRLGYQSDAQNSLCVSYNGLDGYAASLNDALTRPYAAYERIGIRDPDGSYRQLGTTLLQIENEFYGTIRPKRVIFPGERPLHALRERGVEYIEVRCMDLDPFVPVGITAATMRMIDLFLLHCLLSDSPLDSPYEITSLGRNQQRVAAHGREPGLKLERGGAEVLLTDWMGEILRECTPIAAHLDALERTDAHARALETARQGLASPGTLPSARVLETMRRGFDGSHAGFVTAQSDATRKTLLALPFAAAEADRSAAQAAESIAEQQRIEAADTMPFEIYRQQYLAPERLRLPRGGSVADPMVLAATAASAPPAAGMPAGAAGLTAATQGTAMAPASTSAPARQA
ncbi:MAG TPA: glutamate--cysteine ligase [Burkholderiaceae bacterium]|nr:glutamate--cysteine ligase [Burkholderiaceae bacterium]